MQVIPKCPRTGSYSIHARRGLIHLTRVSSSSILLLFSYSPRFVLGIRKKHKNNELRYKKNTPEVFGQGHGGGGIFAPSDG